MATYEGLKANLKKLVSDLQDNYFIKNSKYAEVGSTSSDAESTGWYKVVSFTMTGNYQSFSCRFEILGTLNAFMASGRINLRQDSSCESHGGQHFIQFDEFITKDGKLSNSEMVENNFCMVVHHDVENNKATYTLYANDPYTYYRYNWRFYFPTSGNTIIQKNPWKRSAFESTFYYHFNNPDGLPEDDDIIQYARFPETVFLPPIYLRGNVTVDGVQQNTIESAIWAIANKLNSLTLEDLKYGVVSSKSKK